MCLPGDRQADETSRRADGREWLTADRPRPVPYWLRTTMDGSGSEGGGDGGVGDGDGVEGDERG